MRTSTQGLVAFPLNYYPIGSWPAYYFPTTQADLLPSGFVNVDGSILGFSLLRSDARLYCVADSKISGISNLNTSAGIRYNFTSNINGQATINGTLNNLYALSNIIAASSLLYANLNHKLGLRGSVDGLGLLSGGMVSQIPLDGALNSVSYLFADATVQSSGEVFNYTFYITTSSPYVFTLSQRATSEFSITTQRSFSV